MKRGSKRTDVKRRTLLRHAGALGGTAALAGCVAERFEDEAANTPDGNDTGEETEQSDGDEGGESGGESNDDDEGGADEDDGDGEESPTITERDLTPGDGECGEEDDATIEFLDEHVTVDGAITAPDPCHEAVLDAAEYDETDDELAVTVAVAEGDEDEICQQCIGEVSYGARIAFEGGLPESVVVVHDSKEEQRTVAEAER